MLAIPMLCGHGFAMVAGAIINSCIRHPQRAGFAVCMACEQVVCQECATTWDGINYCRMCLAKKSGTDRSSGGIKAWATAVGMVVISALLFLAGSNGMAWALSVILDRQ